MATRTQPPPPPFIHPPSVHALTHARTRMKCDTTRPAHLYQRAATQTTTTTTTTTSAWPRIATDRLLLAKALNNLWKTNVCTHSKKYFIAGRRRRIARRIRLAHMFVCMPTRPAFEPILYGACVCVRVCVRQIFSMREQKRARARVARQYGRTTTYGPMVRMAVGWLVGHALLPAAVK